MDLELDVLRVDAPMLSADVLGKGRVGFEGGAAGPAVQGGGSRAVGGRLRQQLDSAAVGGTKDRSPCCAREMSACTRMFEEGTNEPKDQSQ